MNIALQVLASLLLLCFVFSGALKWMSIWQIDPTILFGGAVAAWMLARVYNRSFIRNLEKPPLVWNLLFLVLYMLSAVASLSDAFRYTKLAAIALNTLALVGPLALLDKEYGERTFARTLQYFTLLAAIAVHYFYWTGQINILHDSINREVTKLPDYLVLGYLAGLNVIISVLTPSRVSLIQLILSATALVLLSGRGPAVFVPLTLVCTLLIRSRRKDSKGAKIILNTLALLGILTLGLIYWEGGEVLLGRLLSSYDSASGRLADTSRQEEFVTALKVVSEFPLKGAGLAGYGVAAYGLDQNIYPHNLIMEAAAETGILGGLLFVACIVITLRSSISASKTAGGLVVAACLFFTLMNYMKSGGFIGARDLYLLIGVIICFNHEGRPGQDTSKRNSPLKNRGKE